MRLNLGLGLFILSTFIGISSSQKHYLIAPQVIREGVQETVVLNLHGIDDTVNVVASVKLDGIAEFPFNNVNARKPILMRIKYDKPNAVQERNVRQYVELIVTVRQKGSNIYSTKLRMRLIEDSGYIHIQTDRPIYRPEELVKIRVIPLSQQQSAESDREVEIIIRIPLEDVGVEKKLLRMTDPQKFIETSFELPEFPIFGLWSIQARFTDQKVVKWSTREFEVRPYVLPTFNVVIKLDNPYVLVKEDMSEEKITGVLTSEYSYGRKVSGNYYIVAKLKRPSYKKPVRFYQFPSLLERSARINNGKVKFSIRATKVLEILDADEDFNTLENEGATMVIEASVTGLAEGTIESDISRPVAFVRSPYKIDISRMSRYYTPGTVFEIKADVINSVAEEAMQGVDVVLTGPTQCGTLNCPEKQCCLEKECVPCEESKIVSDENGQVNLKINMESDAVKRTYHLMTRKFEVPDENEARLTFNLHPYSSASKSVLQLSAVKKIAEVGNDAFQIEAWFNVAPTELRYLILARGTVVAAGTHQPAKGSSQTAMSIEILGEMVPSFRIFVYYINVAQQEEIVSSSLWVDVKDACKEEIRVTVPDEVLPGAHVPLRYEGSPGALIGISAVDRAAYFLYGGSRLTRYGVFEELNQYDEGCVREGGKNAQHVFEEGGLQLVGGDYSAKDDFNNHCDEGKMKKKKRAVDEKVRSQLNKIDEDLHSCIVDGKIDSSTDESCAERAGRVEEVESYECANAFFESCKAQLDLMKISGRGGRSANENAAADKALATARSNFEESMLWRTEMLGPDGTLNIATVAEDSITTFEFDTVSMHSTDGFCVAETQNMTIFKNVFIRLKMPYSLKRMEQTELRATVFNYGKDMQKVKLMVKMGKDICSHFPEDKFAVLAEMQVDANSAKTTNFAVLPLRIPDSEKVEIEVRAIGKDDVILDHIRRTLLVQPEGEVRDIKDTHAIDLKNKHDGFIDRFDVEFRFPEKYTPGSRQCWIYPFSNFMGPIIEFDPVTKQPKNDIMKLIKMPRGCGEQTMIYMGPNTFAHKYMLSVGKMKPGSAEEKGSVEKLKAGFVNELKYRCNCEPKVWSVFPRAQPSVWLNAYVNKVFAQAKVFYTDMDTTPICASVLWLTTQQKAGDNGDGGSFEAGGKVYHREMHGAVGSRLSLTAYVMMSLVESTSLCPNIANNVGTAVKKAAAYLQRKKDDAQMNQPYALSLVCYAMAIYNPLNSFAVEMREKLMEMMVKSEDNRLAFWKGAPLHQIEGTKTHAYWYKHKPLAIDIETTGYALMTLLHAADTVEEVSQTTLDLTRKIVLWIIEQRDENGGFSTTQDTVVGLQALAEYMIWSSEMDPPKRDVEIDLTISSPEGTEFAEEPMRIHLDKANEASTTPIPLPPGVVAGGVINVQAKGEGEGTLSYRCVYRTLVNEEACHYDLAISTEVPEQNINPRIAKGRPVVLKVNIQVSKPAGLPSGQSIIEINLISGFEADEPSLQKMSRTYFVDGPIERYEIANQKVILYLKEITAESKRLAFFIQRTVNVKDPEPATATVYDYYEPTVQCSHFYGLPDDVPNLRTTPCKDEEGMGDEDLCKCAEGGCLRCRTRKEQLQKTACLPGIDEDCEICQGPDDTDCFNMTAMACKGNYVYEITILKKVEDLTGVFIEFEAQLGTIYKQGPDAGARTGETRKFQSRTDCFLKCKDEDLQTVDRDGNVDSSILQPERTLLVIGNVVEQNIGKAGNPRIKYGLEQNDIVERIYPQEKCKGAKEKLEGKKCKKKKQTEKQKQSCAKSRAIHQSCTNLRLMRRMLITGCDSV